MTAPTNDERFQRYAAALTGWSSWDGDFDVESATASVMAVADAEQAELRAADTAAHVRYLATKRRAEAAEAEAKSLAERLGREILKVARVEALCEQWERNAEWARRTGLPKFSSGEVLRAALIGDDQGVDVEAIKAHIRAKAATLPAGPL